MQKYFEYAQALRHELHMNPELGYDLPMTLALVRRELESMGIPYTEEYGKSSIVATINGHIDAFTIGLRADMDALPIEEISDKPYKSRIPGRMHACGHDANTAILLATARALVDMGDDLRCRVKLLFTPSEEQHPQGCVEMAQKGVMDEIDCVLATHMNPNFPVGSITADKDGVGSSSISFRVDFYGRAAHTTSQHKGVDAIKMAVEAWSALNNVAAGELNPLNRNIFRIGMIEGGKGPGIVADHCWFRGTFRTHQDESMERMRRRLKEVCEGIAQMHGGSVEIDDYDYLPYVNNDELVTELIQKAAAAELGAENVMSEPRTLIGDDFAFFTRRKPGMMFYSGTRGEAPETHTSFHEPTWEIDEGALLTAIKVFTRFIRDNQDGIDFGGKE